MSNARAEQGSTRTHKPLRRIAIGLATALIVWILIGLPLFVFPHIDDPRKVDAIVVLGPSRYGMPYAKRLMDQELAPTLVVSSSAENGQYVADACSEEHTYTVVCFTPAPSTTQGEARAIARLSEQNGWHDIAVVTMVTHVNRARMIISRCFSGTLSVYAYDRQSSIGYWVHQYVYQTGAFVKAIFSPRC